MNSVEPGKPFLTMVSKPIFTDSKVLRILLRTVQTQKKPGNHEDHLARRGSRLARTNKNLLDSTRTRPQNDWSCASGGIPCPPMDRHKREYRCRHVTHNKGIASVRPAPLRIARQPAVSKRHSNAATKKSSGYGIRLACFRLMDIDL